MSEISMAGRPVSQWSDGELMDWMNRAQGGNRCRAETAALRVAIVRVFDDAGPPMTVRQVYYALVSRGTIPKTEQAYRRTAYHLLQMRRRRLLSYDFISDATRWMRKPSTYSSLESFLEISRDAYRRALWEDQNIYLEVWCEKDALAGVLGTITTPWDVPLMITRGFHSETFLYEAAETIKAKRKPAHIYYFGDHDPSGVAISKSTQQKLAGFGAAFQFEVVAVTPKQIEDWDLPTRPTKRTDSRAKNWEGGSVEVDAVPVKTLRELVEGVITQHVDQWAWQETQKAERLERETLDHVLRNLVLVPNNQAARVPAGGS